VEADYIEKKRGRVKYMNIEDPITTNSILIFLSLTVVPLDVTVSLSVLESDIPSVDIGGDTTRTLLFSAQGSDQVSKF
jgi:hypothetical protein